MHRLSTHNTTDDCFLLYLIISHVLVCFWLLIFSGNKVRRGFQNPKPGDGALLRKTIMSSNFKSADNQPAKLFMFQLNAHNWSAGRKSLELLH